MSDAANQLQRACDDLAGKTPDQIAAMVKRRHITGRPSTTGGCPMALMFKNVYGGKFVVGRKHIYRQSGKDLQKIATPKNIAAFVRKFDISGYPELIAPPPRVKRRYDLDNIKPSRKADRHKKPRTNYPRKIVNHWAIEAGR